MRNLFVLLVGVVLVVGSRASADEVLTVAGIGTREVSLLVLLGPIGVGAPSVIAMTMLTRVLHVAVGALAYGLGSTVAPRTGSD